MNKLGRRCSTRDISHGIHLVDSAHYNYYAKNKGAWKSKTFLMPNINDARHFLMSSIKLNKTIKLELNNELYVPSISLIVNSNESNET